MNPSDPKTRLPWGRVGLYFGALGLALLLWVFVVSENEYSMVMNMRLDARDHSGKKALKEEVPEFAQVRLKGTGRALFITLIFKKFSEEFRLVLDLERISEEYNFYLNEYFDRNPRKVVIPSTFAVEFIEVIYPDSVHISLDVYREKKVPVFSQVLVRPAPGYTVMGHPRFTPDTVSIAGSRELVESITQVSTQTESLFQVDLPINMSIDLQQESGHLLEYTPEMVNYQLDIQAISERIISEIPVQVINPRPDLQIFVSPQTVALTVVGGDVYIAALQPEDIQVTIDFEQWNSKQQFYEPAVVVPEGILEWMDLSPKNLELVVTKRAG